MVSSSSTQRRIGRVAVVLRSFLTLLVLFFCSSVTFAAASTTTTAAATLPFRHLRHGNHQRSLQTPQDNNDAAAQEQQPLVVGQPSTVLVQNIQIELRNIDTVLTDSELTQWETVVSNWADDFFVRGGATGRGSDVTSTVTVTGQTVMVEGNNDGTAALLLTYDHRITLTPSTANVIVQDLVLLPYLNIFFNAGLGESLRAQIPSLANLPRRTIAVPRIVETPDIVTTTSPTSISPTLGPTMRPSVAPVTSIPTATPVSILVPTTTTTTASPIIEVTTTTAAPTAVVGRVVNAVVENVVFQFPPGSSSSILTADDSRVWEQVTQTWWEAFYDDTTTTADSSGVQDVGATFAVQSQQITSSTTGDAEDDQLVVIADVTLRYVDQGTLEDPTVAVLEPFQQQGDGASYLRSLQSQGLLLDAAVDGPVVVTVGAPVGPTSATPFVDDGPNAGLIVSIFLIMLLVLIAVGLYIYFNLQWKERRRVQSPPSSSMPPVSGYANGNDKDTLASEKPAAAFQNRNATPSMPFDATTLGDGSDLFKDDQSNDMNSLATSNFEYDKVGAASRNKKSIASSLPGDSASMASSRSYNTTSDIPNEDEEDQFVIYAPAGRLGLVVDNPDEGAPVIYSIKPDSVLSDQIQVGDRLIGVDEVDVSGMSPVKVSKLISKRSMHPLRKLTLTRQRVDGGGGGGESVATHSNFDTMSRLSGMESTLDDTMSRASGMESNVDTMSRMSGGGIDTDAEEENEYDDERQLFSGSDDETSFVASMSRVSTGTGNGDDDTTQKTPAMS